MNTSLSRFAGLMLVCIGLSACNPNPKSAEEAPASSIEKPVAPLADKAQLKDEELFPFMLGGVYFFNGYGGAQRTFDELIRPAVTAAPGSPSFVTSLQEAYHRYFIFPFKPEQDPGGKEAKKTFADWWKVHNKKELEPLMTWLLEEGDQKEFEKYKAIIEAHGGPQANLAQFDFNTYGLDSNRNTNETMSFVQQNYNDFSKAGIKAWDLARFVNNVCIAYQANYFTEAEAKQWLNRAATVARKNYDSWIAYYNDFTMGRKFFNGGKDEQPIIAETAGAMLLGDYSIYKYLAFD